MRSLIINSQCAKRISSGGWSVVPGRDGSGCQLEAVFSVVVPDGVDKVVIVGASAAVVTVTEKLTLAVLPWLVPATGGLAVGVAVVPAGVDAGSMGVTVIFNSPDGLVGNTSGADDSGGVGL